MKDDESAAPVKDEPVPLERWRHLYAAAAKVRELEPWLWMEETDLFGVKDPESEKVVFVSVMGLLGEYHAIALYQGAKAVSQFWGMQDAVGSSEDVASMIFEIRQLQASFGKKSELEASEKRAVKELGLKFKGTNVWPCFRSHRPGYFPWDINAEEARILQVALEQLLVVAPRVKEDRRLIARKPGAFTYLVRMPHRKDGVVEWRDEHHEYPPPTASFRISIPNELVDAVQKLEPLDMTVEMDVAVSVCRIGKKGERPQLPYMMLAADAKSQFVFGVELLSIDSEIEDMWVQVPAKFLAMLVKHGIHPKRLALRTPWVERVMQGICKDLGIEIEADLDLPAVTEARRSVERFMR